MDPTMTAARLVGGALLLLSNGFFVTTEFAMTRVRQFSPEEFQREGLERAWEMTERLEIYLSGCQVGITISSIGLGVVAEPAVAAVLDPVFVAAGVGDPGATGHTAIAAIVGFALINFLHVGVGEQAPTYLGIERTKTVARYGAPVLYWWTKLTYPVIVVADRFAKSLLGLFGVTMERAWTEEADEGPETVADLRRTMGESLASVGISDERRHEILRALDIGELPVAEITTPRSAVVALSTTEDPEAALERMGSSPHVRFPLVEDDLEEFVGVVYTPAVLGHIEALRAGETTFEAIATPPMTVDAATVVSDLIDRFQAEHQELALVVEDGRVVGLVTATDAFEAIAGQLEDPLDVELS